MFREGKVMWQERSSRPTWLELCGHDKKVKASQVTSSQAHVIVNVKDTSFVLTKIIAFTNNVLYLCGETSAYAGRNRWRRTWRQLQWIRSDYGIRSSVQRQAADNEHTGYRSMQPKQTENTKGGLTRTDKIVSVPAPISVVLVFHVTLWPGSSRGRHDKVIGTTTDMSVRCRRPPR
jgi:hypothetical protein